MWCSRETYSYWNWHPPVQMQLLATSGLEDPDAPVIDPNGV